MGLDQAPSQGQAQTGSRVLLVTPRIDLLEFREQARQMPGRDANAGVLHLEQEVPLVIRGGANRHAHGVRREFDGVGQEVVQNLLEPYRIENDGVESWIDLGDECNAFAPDARMRMSPTPP